MSDPQVANTDSIRFSIAVWPRLKAAVADLHLPLDPASSPSTGKTDVDPQLKSSFLGSYRA